MFKAKCTVRRPGRAKDLRLRTIFGGGLVLRCVSYQQAFLRGYNGIGRIILLPTVLWTAPSPGTRPRVIRINRRLDCVTIDKRYPSKRTILRFVDFASCPYPSTHYVCFLYHCCHGLRL